MNDSFNPLESPVLFLRPLVTHIESAWTEHVPFAYALIEMLRPRSLVELGSHRGISYCAFCQAVERLRLDTRCHAVDTWQGDPQAGMYGDEIYRDLRAHHDPRYASFSTLLRKTFDEALADVPDGSVDLLHIDGLHTYEAVKHDYETWRPKLSERGVVIFHDIAVVKPGFGVHQFWSELTPRFPHFAFEHGYGLGVLLVGAQPPEAIRVFVEKGATDPEPARRLFSAMGQQIRLEGVREEERRQQVELAQSSWTHRQIVALKKCYRAFFPQK